MKNKKLVNRLSCATMNIILAIITGIITLSCDDPKLTEEAREKTQHVLSKLRNPKKILSLYEHSKKPTTLVNRGVQYGNNSGLVRKYGLFPAKHGEIGYEVVKNPYHQDKLRLSIEEVAKPLNNLLNFVGRHYTHAPVQLPLPREKEMELSEGLQTLEIKYGPDTVAVLIHKLMKDYTLGVAFIPRYVQQQGDIPENNNTNVVNWANKLQYLHKFILSDRIKSKLVDIYIKNGKKLYWANFYQPDSLVSFILNREPIEIRTFMSHLNDSTLLFGIASKMSDAKIVAYDLGYTIPEKRLEKILNTLTLKESRWFMRASKINILKKIIYESLDQNHASEMTGYEVITSRVLKKKKKLNLLKKMSTEKLLLELLDRESVKSCFDEEIHPELLTIIVNNSVKNASDKKLAKEFFNKI